MSCRRLQPRLLALLEGTLTSKQQRKMVAHVATCPTCTTTLRDMQQTMALVRTMDVPEPAETYWDTFLSTLQQRIRQEVVPGKRRSPRRKLWQMIPGPALAALAASLLLVSALPLLRSVWQHQAVPGVVLLNGEDAGIVADLDFLKHLDLLEEVDVVEDVDAAL